MAEFIGARISLVSRSDIRYVGTLHEINSETSTVALEDVTSYGTEGRKSDPSEEIPPADGLYDYIVFRGSDVKDLRIEEAPAAKENKPPQVPNDPAILGSGSRPQAHNQAQAPVQNQQAPVPPNVQQQGPPPQGGPPGPPGPPGGPFGQPSQYPPFYPPPPAGWGRGGPPGPPGPPGPGYPGMPYGAPPGWYPPPGQGYPHPPPFPPYGYPPVPPGQGPPGQPFQQGQPGQQPGQPPRPAPIGPGANKQPSPAPAANKQAEQKPAAKAAAAAAKPPTPPVASKPSVAEVQASVSHTQTNASQSAATVAASQTAPTGPKSNRVQPVLPLQAPTAVKAPLQGTAGNVTAPGVQGSASLRDATQAATAAVAAAMAKLPAVSQTNGNAMDNLTKKVNEMRTNDPIRAPRHPGTTGGFTGRGGRGRGGARQPSAKVEVPATDFDFELSNAKFNKHDLVKEAIAGSPLGEHPPVGSPVEPEAPLPGYNKSTSFFDNISSESKDRIDSGGSRPGGREWRGEEQKKNVETFGQGSVDNGYRGGYRGRGGRRGGFRGRGFGGNGQPGRGRGGGYRGRGDSQVAEQ